MQQQSRGAAAAASQESQQQSRGAAQQQEEQPSSRSSSATGGQGTAEQSSGEAEAALARRTSDGSVHLVDLEPDADDVPDAIESTPPAKRRRKGNRQRASRQHHKVPKPERMRLAALALQQP